MSRARRVVGIDTGCGHGGFLTARDLAEFRPEWVEPLKADYRGYDHFA